MSNIIEIVKKLADREAKRTEADIQAGIRDLLLQSSLDLDDEDLDVKLESQLGDRRRIDVEIGSVVIEVKKDLRKGKILADAIEQLSGYVEVRTQQTGQNYIGILSDGLEWRCFHLKPSKEFVEVSKHLVNSSSPDADKLVAWLDGVLATKQGVIPTPEEINSKLGVESSSYAINHATLLSLYEGNKHLPTVQMKRLLWAKLLTTALGSQFTDSDELFVEHTLLVNVSEIIAHAVLGLNVNDLSPASLLSGSQFETSGIYGVVESDFFDWVIEVDEGDIFIRSLARKISRFNWGEVSYDIMKVLYESIIDQELRKQLGEYYTPDWLAEVIVEKTITDPLNKRVLDPSCGSGTFLFHAVKNLLKKAEQEKLSISESLTILAKNVIGFDIHPVAVTLARVTYLLAIGRDNLMNPARGEINIPVYLADSMQWRQKQYDLWSKDQVVIETNSEGQLFASELRFPHELLQNSHNFDELVKDLADKATQANQGKATSSLIGVFRRLAIPEKFHETLTNTFVVMCELHKSGRDHIWGYYVRNLVRPAWLGLPQNRVDILIGNPPWLSYRHMPKDMQDSFREMSEERSLWHGAKNATHQDLSALFVAKSIETYLDDGGKFAFVMPNSVTDREYFGGFREGNYYTGKGTTTYVEFAESWDLRRLRPHFFPRGASVIFGKRSQKSVKMPLMTEYWTGRIKEPKSSWNVVKKLLKFTKEEIKISSDNDISPYHSQFSQGATIVPKVLLSVVEKVSSPVGLASGRKLVKSQRSAYEKKPWINIPDLEGTIESEFIRPLYTGASILPFRCQEPELAIIPWNGKVLMDGESELIDMYPGLCDWWRKSEEIWNEYRTSDRLTLLERINYHKGLSQQFPIPRERILYAKSGMHICSAILSNRQAVIDSKLYWATTESKEESYYLCAILNAEITTLETRPLMSYGKDERDVCKHVWQLKIPKFSPESDLHLEISKIGKALEKEVSQLELRDVYFANVRQDIRKHIRSSSKGKELEKLVKELLLKGFSGD
jgi:SAM-dependent methyltransferase